MLLAVHSVLLVLSTLSNLVVSDAPDCGVRNQFRGYCFSFDYCTSYSCASEKCGNFPRRSVILKIQQTRIIAQCAITNSSTLKHVTGINSNIHVLASGSFAYLPNLESILLPYNRIRELHHGIFYNVNVPLLDLSWNKIIYISEGAFNGITGLKYLNLSKNELSTIPVENLPRSIVKINLSYNFLERLAINGAKRPDLTSINLSHNSLKKLALSFDNTLEELDLTKNELNNIDFYDVNECENLKIPSNLFTRVPEFLQYSRIKRVALHPNPWKCDELKKLWTHLQNNDVEEERANVTETQPLCAINNEVSARIQNADNNFECDDDNHCNNYELCRARRCWNPCTSGICEITNVCYVENHEIECFCPNHEKKNPQELFSPCYDVDCFVDEDCNPGGICFHNRTCIRDPINFQEAERGDGGEAVPQRGDGGGDTIVGGSGGGGGGGGGESERRSGAGGGGGGGGGAGGGGGGQPSSSYSGSGSYPGYGTVSPPRGQPYPGGYQYHSYPVAPDPTQNTNNGASYSAAGSVSYSSHGYYPVPQSNDFSDNQGNKSPSIPQRPQSYPVDDEVGEDGLPWWFNEIPKVSPSNIVKPARSEDEETYHE
ncbi:hypothetical protein NQ315_010343 [Exocentrus adspersus]|uniref:Uncharacterized protein n=1 Tax=Exocentrus adspersus TaxID=1586481 RepID=A0AAV8WAZ0_9CUCU|nr:hypothetical protein NQ315_010343 [Exocentrus adspersus]